MEQLQPPTDTFLKMASVQMTGIDTLQLSLAADMEVREVRGELQGLGRRALAHSALFKPRVTIGFGKSQGNVLTTAGNIFTGRKKDSEMG